MEYEDEDGAKETVGLSRWPASGTITAIAPGAPTSLTATANGTTQIDLSWTAPASDGGSDITGYKIEISPNGTDTWTTHLADTTSTNTTYAHTGLAASTTRHYRVSAINTIGTSTASNVDSATTGTGTNTLPTASNGEVTATEDTDYPFTATDFNFSDTDAGAALSSVKITSLPASGKGTLEVDGTVIASGDLPKAVTKVDIDASKLTYSPPANANGNDYATFQFKVNDGTDDSAAASTMTIDVTAVNDAPTVANTIPDRSATVGTAFDYAFPPNTFNDADGNTLTYTAMKTDNAALPTWLSFTASTRAFSGTPQAADVATVSVKVTASDGNGGSVSDEFDITVSAASNTPATGAPTITGTPRVGQTLTAVTTAIMDDDGLTGVSYTYQWIRVDGGTETNIAGAMASTYTLVADDQGKTIKVKVSFTDDASNAETLTSVATAVVAAARPPRVSITNDLSVREDIGTAVVPVTLSWPTQVSLSVPWSTSDLNAVSPDDFTDGQGALTFAPGASRADISIRIADDGVQEGAEFFTVTLGTGEGYSLEHASAVVNILDNDDDELLPSRVTVDGTTLVLTYDEVLDSASTPSPSNFYVTADGMRVDVDQVSVDGSMVTLTLATAVQARQTVTLGYAGTLLKADGVGGKEAVSFSAWLVTNNTVGGGTEPPGDGGGGGTEPPGDGGGGGTEPPGGGGGGTEPPSGGGGGGDGTGTPGVTVSKTALTVPEEDTTGDSYTVVVDSEPAADVTVTVAGHAGTAVTPTPATLTFTTTNWDTAQTVTVTAGNDADTADETVALTHSATSTDTDYDGISITGVAVTVNDNDTAQVMGVTVAPGNAHLVVTWTAVDNATGYTVQWTSGGDGYNTDDRQATVTPGSTTSHTIDSLTNGTAYTVRVIATRTGANDGPPSAEMTGTPIGEPEPVPALPVAGVIGLGLLLLGTGGRALRGRARG